MPPALCSWKISLLKFEDADEQKSGEKKKRFFS